MTVLTRATRVHGQMSTAAPSRSAAKRSKKTTVDVASSATRLTDGSDDTALTRQELLRWTKKKHRTSPKGASPAGTIAGASHASSSSVEDASAASDPDKERQMINYGGTVHRLKRLKSGKTGLCGRTGIRCVYCFIHNQKMPKHTTISTNTTIWYCDECSKPYSLLPISKKTVRYYCMLCYGEFIKWHDELTSGIH